VNTPDEPPRDAQTPRVGFKTLPADFLVTELPAYEPSGAGDHVFVWFEKTGLTTDVAMRHLARALGANPRDAGVAGVKDRVAVSTQWGSFLLPKGDPEALLAPLAVEGLRPLRITRHGHKLKPGHLKGNRFAVRLRSLDGAPLEPRLGSKLAGAAAFGVPNAFGAQRFGRDGDNAEVAARFVRGETQPPRDKKQARFYFSALQSQLFNRLLSVRVAEGTFGTILPGDVAKKEENGALFDVALEGPELADAVRRAATLAVSPTGPMFGVSMRWPAGRPLELEREILAQSNVPEAAWTRHRHLGEGTRRALRLLVEHLQVRVEGMDIVVEFVLGKGEYATTFLQTMCELNEIRAPRAPLSDEPEPEISDEVEKNFAT
jgi:tRNA pseudouridine13 synthase